MIPIRGKPAVQFWYGIGSSPHARGTLLDEIHEEGPSLLLVFDAQEDTKKWVVQVNYKVKKAGDMNIVKTGQAVDAAGISSPIGNGYTLLEGEL